MARSALDVTLAVLLPPLAVYRAGGFGLSFWGNVALTLLGFVPGVAHALWTVLRPEPPASRPDPAGESDPVAGDPPDS
jgi:uncharacterized membrane protein YqaE (UPF0057 family)